MTVEAGEKDRLNSLRAIFLTIFGTRRRSIKRSIVRAPAQDIMGGLDASLTEIEVRWRF